MDKEVRKDCFTFARLRYRSWTQRRSFNWYTDYRDSDLNFSFRLHELTAMRVDPEGTYVEITDKRLFDYPFIFMSGVGGLELNDEEAAILRRSLIPIRCKFYNLPGLSQALPGQHQAASINLSV